MEFNKLINLRESCRKFDPSKDVSYEKIEKIITSAILAPSACNGQPYYFTVCKGEEAKKVAQATTKMGMNKFALDAPCLIVISEKPYVKTAALGAKLKNNDYRSMDIGIAASYITLEATNQGLSTCILGWLEEEEIQKILNIKERIRLVIVLGYPKDDKIREKKRKTIEEISNLKTGM